MRKLTLVAATFAAGATFVALGSTALAGGPSPANLPPNWHVHDGMTTLGPQHKPIGFFAVILGATAASDPAICPDATDKAFLPQRRQDGQPLRAGMCQTSEKIVHLRTLPRGTAGPDGWSGPIPTQELGDSWDTYYLVTDLPQTDG